MASSTSAMDIRNLIGAQANMGSYAAAQPMAMASGAGASYGGMGQASIQSMTIGELAWWNDLISVATTVAPIVISVLERPMPAAGGIGQQSAGQVLQAMQAGQMSAKDLTIGQLSWWEDAIHVMPDVINVGKTIFQMLETKPGVDASSLSGLSAQGLTVADFDRASQAIKSGAFSLRNLKVGQMNMLDPLISSISQVLGGFMNMVGKLPGVGSQSINQQDFWSGFLGTINQVAGVVPNVVNAVGQVVKIVNQFSSQSMTSSQSLSSQGWTDWLQPIGAGIGGAFGGRQGSQIGGTIGGTVKDIFSWF
jgi:hypothetical protein